MEIGIVFGAVFTWVFQPYDLKSDFTCSRAILQGKFPTPAMRIPSFTGSFASIPA
jgi:hypothetical protein